jgi:peptidoglycan hydrolase-like protein with peptidoglycan-binding domain
MAELLVPGSTGPEVTELQNKLVGMGYFVGNVDGVFGHKTAAAVAYLQSCHGLDIDAIVGPQVRDLLDMNAAGNISVTMEATWPTLDVWRPGVELVVQLRLINDAVASAAARVVMQFRSPAGQDHAVDEVTVNQGATTMARLQLPDSIAGTQGEVHWTGWVFDNAGQQMPDEGAGSFRVDLPDRV